MSESTYRIAVIAGDDQIAGVDEGIVIQVVRIARRRMVREVGWMIADGNEVAVQELVLTHEGYKRVQ